MSMMLFIVIISTVIMMYTELRSTRCVAQSYPIVYPPAQRLYLERNHNVKLYQDGTETLKMHLIHDTSQFWHWIWLEAEKNDGRSYILCYEAHSTSISLCSTASQKENN